MSLTTSATFAFKREHRSFGSSQARLDLLADGCHDSAASQAWVDGHWALILWKLAAFVRWSPDRHLHMWSFENAVDQLRYRCVPPLEAARVILLTVAGLATSASTA